MIDVVMLENFISVMVAMRKIIDARAPKKSNPSTAQLLNLLTSSQHSSTTVSVIFSPEEFGRFCNLSHTLKYAMQRVVVTGLGAVTPLGVGMLIFLPISSYLISIHRLPYVVEPTFSW